MSGGNAIYLVGTIAGTPVALPAGSIEAVVRIDTVAPAPGAPPAVRGLVAIRSRILTLIDSCIVVGAPSCATDYMAIVSVDGHGYGLMLDHIEDVMTLDGITPLRSGLAPGWAALDPAIHDSGTRVLLVVDPAAIIAAAACDERQVA